MRAETVCVVKTKFRVLLRVCMWMCLLALAAAVLLMFVGLKYHSDYQRRAAQFDLSKIGEVPQRSAVYDVNGELYSHLQGENRMVVPLGSVSGWFIQALLAREDSRFWEHKGLDYRGIARAAYTNLRSGAVRQGASTLTQQLARNSLDLTGRNFDRKALEALLAQRIERNYTKQQILEFYINRIYFGSGFYGIEAAARGYFDKPASELTLSESALLAGLICSPNKFSPRRNLDAARAERDVVLNRMVELHMIGTEDATVAKAAKLMVSQERPFQMAHDYVVDAVNRELENILAPEVVGLGGLRVFTTIDPQLQRAAESAADRQLTLIENGKKYPHPKKADFAPAQSDEDREKPTDYLQAALVAVDNRTGAIRAIVGGRDYSQSNYSRALLSKRQIGSTFKPFVYAAAFQRGMLPGTLVSDEKIDPKELRTVSNNWSPSNSDDEYLGLQPAAVGLVRSRNTMSVRVGEFAGISNVHRLANDLGIGQAMQDLPVSYLGAFEATLKDLTAAYTAFPNLGVLRPSYLIARVEDRSGNVLYKAEMPEKRVMSADTAWMISNVLEQVLKSGTAAKATQMGWKKPSAGKTGTTNDFFDAWFVGYTSSITCGVWVGMDKPQTIMEKGYGSALALPIWADFMKQVPEKIYPAKAFEAPFELSKVRLCTASGGRATSMCEHMHTTYEAALPAQRVPAQVCTVHPEPTPVYASQEPLGADPYAPVHPAAFSSQVAPPPPVATTRGPGFVSGSGIGGLPVNQGSSAPVVARDRYVPPAPAAVPAPIAEPPAPRVVSRPAETVARQPVQVQRTSRGMRIYHGRTDDEEDVRPAVAQERKERPERPVRVMRAIPVEESDRPAADEEPDPEVVHEREERPVRVERAIPVRRAEAVESRPRRVVRFFDWGDDD